MAVFNSLEGDVNELTLKDLDDTLTWLRKSGNPKPEYRQVLHKQMIFEKLVRDGYLLKERKMDDIFFSLTFEGALFIQNDGYVKAFETERRKSQMGLLKEYMLIAFSALAGIGAIAIVIVELLKHYVWRG